MPLGILATQTIMSARGNASSKARIFPRPSSACKFVRRSWFRAISSRSLTSVFASNQRQTALPISPVAPHTATVASDSSIPNCFDACSTCLQIM